MRLIALWLSGLIAVSSANAAPFEQHGEDGPSLVISAGQRTTQQTNPSAGKWTTPHTNPQSCPKGAAGKWPYCISTSSRKCPEDTTGKWPDCARIVQHCPEGTTGKWPKCKAKPTANCAQKGMTGKWPNCREPDEPECPKGPSAIGLIAAKSSQSHASTVISARAKDAWS